MDDISLIPDLEEVIFIVGYLKEKMIEYLTSKYKNIKLSFVVQKEYKGLAHAISLTREYIKDGDKIFIILGDTIFKLNLAEIISKNENSLGVCEVDNPSRFGVAILNDKGIIIFEIGYDQLNKIQSEIKKYKEYSIIVWRSGGYMESS